MNDYISDTIMNFGKYKGISITKIPLSYIDWLDRNLPELEKECKPYQKTVRKWIDDNREIWEESYTESLLSWFDIIDFD